MAVGNTIGIVVVAFLAARAAGVVITMMMSADWGQALSDYPPQQRRGRSRGTRFSSESAPRPFHHGIRERGGTILGATLPPVGGRTSRTCELTSSIVPRGTPFHCAVEFELLPVICHGYGCHAAAVASRVHRNSVPSTQMRCMITANRRARA